MTWRSFFQADAFTNKAFGGNPAAVVGFGKGSVMILDLSFLRVSTTQVLTSLFLTSITCRWHIDPFAADSVLQAVAAENNLSETAFWRIREGGCFLSMLLHAHRETGMRVQKNFACEQARYAVSDMGLILLSPERLAIGRGAMLRFALVHSHSRGRSVRTRDLGYCSCDSKRGVGCQWNTRAQVGTLR